MPENSFKLTGMQIYLDILFLKFIKNANWFIIIFNRLRIISKE